MKHFIRCIILIMLFSACQKNIISEWHPSTDEMDGYLIAVDYKNDDKCNIIFGVGLNERITITDQNDSIIFKDSVNTTNTYFNSNYLFDYSQRKENIALYLTSNNPNRKKLHFKLNPNFSVVEILWFHNRWNIVFSDYLYLRQ